MITNVIWQSKNGNWNRGFFDCVVLPKKFMSRQKYIIDTNEFEWVILNQESFDNVLWAYNGLHPKKFEVVAYNDANRSKCEEYDRIASGCLDYPVIY